jgi:hypothetical protein
MPREGHPLGHEQRATHRETSDSSAARIRAERTRAREIHHLLSKLSFSVQQAEVIERFSRSHLARMPLVPKPDEIYDVVQGRNFGSSAYDVLEAHNLTDLVERRAYVREDSKSR